VVSKAEMVQMKNCLRQMTLLLKRKEMNEVGCWQAKLTVRQLEERVQSGVV
jgi:hypothetical protein